MTAGRLRCCGVSSWAIVGQVLVCLALLCSTPSEAAPQCPVLELDGSTGYATASSTVFPNTTSLVSFTAEAWIYRRDYDSQVILSDDAWDFFLQETPGITGLVARLYAASGNVISTSFYDQRVVDINKWHHVALVFNAATMQLRIALDGVVGFPRTVDLTNFATFSSNFIVGAFPTNSYFNGYIDDIRISDVARYSANFTPPASLNADANTRALYQFFEAPGATTFADASGKGKTLTGTGGAQTGMAAGTCLVTPQTSQSDCLFNWAEGNYPNLFTPAGATSATSAPYYYRYYSQTTAYLGTSSANNRVYYLGPASNNVLLDVGELSTWLATANCQ